MKTWETKVVKSVFWQIELWPYSGTWVQNTTFGEILKKKLVSFPEKLAIKDLFIAVVPNLWYAYH